MRLKLFAFPDLFLLLYLLWLLIGKVIMANTALDIRMNDLFFLDRRDHVSGVFGLSVYWLIFISWVSHILLRRFGLLSLNWRVAHVAVTMISIVVERFSRYMGSEFAQRDLRGSHTIPWYFWAYSWSDWAFNVAQLALWIAAVILARKDIKRNGKWSLK